MVDATETTKAKFNSARQKESEDVTAWSTRLEDLFVQTPDYHNSLPGQINAELCNAFYQGLRSSLKDITGHLFDKIKDSDKLKVAIHQIENDKKEWKSSNEKGTSKTVPSKSAVDTQEKSEIEELRGVIQQLAVDVKSIKEGRQEQRYHGSSNNRCQGRAYQFNFRPQRT